MRSTVEKSFIKKLFRHRTKTRGNFGGYGNQRAFADLGARNQNGDPRGAEKGPSRYCLVAGRGILASSSIASATLSPISWVLRALCPDLARSRVRCPES